MSLLDELIPQENETKVCPNVFPKIPPGEKRLAVVGEAPGADEMVALEPFVGTSGRLLRAILSWSGIACDQVFFGNICQHPIDPERIEWDDPRITSGLERLRDDLQKFRPNCVLLLGKAAFHAFQPDLCYQSRKGFIVPLSDWRGSITLGTGRGLEIKCVATYHPAYILRAYGDMPYFKFDVARAVRHSLSPGINAIVREGVLRPSLTEVLSYIDRIRRTSSRTTFDIEGYADDVGVTMLSLCTTPVDGIVVPFWISGKNYWTEDEEVQVWQALAGLWADDQVPKEAHQCFYELFVLAWRHRAVINNVSDDTLMLHWENFPEAAGDPNENDTGKKKRQGIGRSLADCCSIYTEQEYYKAGRTSENVEVKLRYNLTDSQVTNEIKTVVTPRLLLASLEHYRFNINLIPAYNYLMLRGCKLDKDRLASYHVEVAKEIADLTYEIDSQILSAAADAGVLTQKRKSDPLSFNVGSDNQLRWLLFKHLAYKPLKKYLTDGGKDGTSDDVLLHYWTKEQNPLVRLVIRCVRKRTRLSDINKLTPNADGRIRSSYDIVGTNTGRLSSRSSTALGLYDGKWESTGTNLQNVTKELRSCFIPDSPEFDFWQFDLAGADAWTVAADLAAIGHPAMLDDLLYGIKPALVLYYMLQEHAAGRSVAGVNRLDRAVLKNELRNVKIQIDSLEGKTDSQGRPLDWQYLCCKRVQHGSNYGAQGEKIAEVIFGDSDGSIVLTAREADFMQSLYKLRYNTDVRNQRIRRVLSDTGQLIAACGIRRQFFQIRNRREIDDATVREASAFEPQANTTWATNKALERLWYARENRTSRGGLFVEPLLQIHDAVAGQYKSNNRQWVADNLKRWFDNPLVVCGTKLVIPADGKYGANWKDCKHAITT
jgi:uracil-DNA glycosylase family 4